MSEPLPSVFIFEQFLVVRSPATAGVTTARLVDRARAEPRAINFFINTFLTGRGPYLNHTDLRNGLARVEPFKFTLRKADKLRATPRWVA